MIVTLVLAAIAAQARARATPDAPPDKLTSVVQPSIVHVRAQYSGLVRDRQGKDLNHGRAVTAGTSCSGFIVDPNGYITTAGQCLDLDLGAEQVIDAWPSGCGGAIMPGRQGATPTSASCRSTRRPSGPSCPQPDRVTFARSPRARRLRCVHRGAAEQLEAARACATCAELRQR
jgi:hypothetical protein